MYAHHDGDFGKYFAQKIQKLQSINGKTHYNLESEIFKGCFMFVNGATDPPIEELRRLIQIHGGIFESYQVGRVTHFICNMLTEAQLKRENARKIIRNQSPMKYVTSLWILDSIKHRRRMPELDYIPKGLNVPGRNLLLFCVSSSRLTGDNTGNVAMENIINDVRDIDSPAIYDLNDTNHVDDDSNHNDIHTNSNDKSTNAAITTNNDSNISPHKSSIAGNNRLLTSETNPDFLKQYFSNSRLHFIGQWRNRLPKIIKSFQSESYRHLNIISNHRQRIVIHVDMDCFFVNAIIRNNPSLQHIPVAVAHSSSAGSSEISSCNYPARKCGLQNGMFMSTAKKLCPKLHVVAYDFPLYERLSDIVYKILLSSDAIKVEPVSVDEAYLEFYGDNVEDGIVIAEKIRSHIFNDTDGCTASAGIGPNMLLARLATKKAKPNGIYCIGSDDRLIENHMKSVTIQDIPGIGWSIRPKLEELGLKNASCDMLLKYSKDDLNRMFGGRSGAILYDACRGHDDTPLSEVQAVKSIGAEVNWGLRFTQLDNAIVFLHKICEEVGNRMLYAERKGRCITMKIKKRHPNAPIEPSKFLGCGWCENLSKSQTLQNYFNGTDVAIMANTTKKLFVELLGNKIPINDLRGMGVQVSKLSDAGNGLGRPEGLKSNGLNLGSGTLDRHLVTEYRKDSAKVDRSAIQHQYQSLEMFDEDDDDRMMHDAASNGLINDVEGIFDMSSLKSKHIDTCPDSHENNPWDENQLPLMGMNVRSKDDLFESSVEVDHSHVRFGSISEVVTASYHPTARNPSLKRHDEFADNVILNNHNEGSDNEVIDVSDTMLSEGINPIKRKHDFTLTQEEFLHALPEELLDDATEQLIQYNQRIKSSTSSSSSSSLQTSRQQNLVLSMEENVRKSDKEIIVMPAITDSNSVKIRSSILFNEDSNSSTDISSNRINASFKRKTNEIKTKSKAKSKSSRGTSGRGACTSSRQMKITVALKIQKLDRDVFHNVPVSTIAEYLESEQREEMLRRIQLERADRVCVHMNKGKRASDDTEICLTNEHLAYVGSDHEIAMESPERAFKANAIVDVIAQGNVSDTSTGIVERIHVAIESNLTTFRRENMSEVILSLKEWLYENSGLLLFKKQFAFFTKACLNKNESLAMKDLQQLSSNVCSVFINGLDDGQMDYMRNYGIWLVETSQFDHLSIYLSNVKRLIKNITAELHALPNYIVDELVVISHEITLDIRNPRTVAVIESLWHACFGDNYELIWQVIMNILQQQSSRRSSEGYLMLPEVVKGSQMLSIYFNRIVLEWEGISLALGEMLQKEVVAKIGYKVFIA